MRVLVVDDDFLTCFSTVELLAKSGHIAAGFQNAYSAIHVLEKIPFDVVITDLRMPGMNGITFLKSVRANFPDIAVIVVTSHWTSSAYEEVAENGVYETLEKPFRFETLAEILKHIPSAARPSAKCTDSNSRVQTLQPLQMESYAAV